MDKTIDDQIVEKLDEIIHRATSMKNVFPNDKSNVKYKSAAWGCNGIMNLAADAQELASKLAIAKEGAKAS